jgi:hypothetical protein
MSPFKNLYPALIFIALYLLISMIATTSMMIALTISREKRTQSMVEHRLKPPSVLSPLPLIIDMVKSYAIITQVQMSLGHCQ